MKKHLALLLIAPLLIIALAPAFYPCDSDSPGANLYDGFNQFFALASPIAHFERDPKWASILYSTELYYRLPQALPTTTGTRAPPA